MITVNIFFESTLPIDSQTLLQVVANLICFVWIVWLLIAIMMFCVHSVKLIHPLGKQTPFLCHEANLQQYKIGLPISNYLLISLPTEAVW